jgi:hypothetical protein
MEIVFASPSLGPIPALAIIRDAPFVFAGGGVHPEARRAARAACCCVRSAA